MIKQRKIKLGELAWACYLYTRFTNFDEAYGKFIRKINNDLNLLEKSHRESLLIWLNKWGCRQFAKKYHKLASEKILKWYKSHKDCLFGKEKTLLELTEEEFGEIGNAYESLREVIVSKRNAKGGKKLDITCGATAASKILFALRPRALLPWDETIRKKLEYRGDKKSYICFLRSVKDILQKLCISCKRKKIKLNDLPKILGRTYSSVPKLVDEYYWVTITHKCEPPKKKDIKKWLKWGL